MHEEEAGKARRKGRRGAGSSRWYLVPPESDNGRAEPLRCTFWRSVRGTLPESTLPVLNAPVDAPISTLSKGKSDQRRSRCKSIGQGGDTGERRQAARQGRGEECARRAHPGLVLDA